MLCPIWHHLYNLKNVKNTHVGVLLLVKFQVEACKRTKSNTPPWVFFVFFKFYQGYEIAQSVIYTCWLTTIKLLKKTLQRRNLNTTQRKNDSET